MLAPPRPREQQQERLRSLDGVRGIAAIVVLIYHLSLIAKPYLDTGRRFDAWWWIAQSPLKLFTAGTEAVLVFFVLSGLVVSLPAIRAGFSWLEYYPRRLVRLYFPVWGALILAAALLLARPRSIGDVRPGSWLADTSAFTITPGFLLSHASLTRVGYSLDNVLWSLRWEIAFSLLLPVFVLVARLLRNHPVLAGSTALLQHGMGRVLREDSLIYLPVFFAGTLLAVNLGAVQEWARHRGRSFWAVEIITSLVLIVFSHTARGVLPGGATLSAMYKDLAVLGAVGIVLAALGSGYAQKALTARLPRWLGKISFSLYLVHVPILQSVGFAVGDENWLLIAAVGLPASLVVGWMLHATVEVPSHRFARRLGRFAVTVRRHRVAARA